MGYFYTGYCVRNDEWQINDEMLLKIGETNQQIEKRIEQTKVFGLKCLKFQNETKAQRLFIESFVRLKMSEIYKNIGIDYFLYKSKDIKNADFRESEALEIANKAIQFAKEGCKMIQLEFVESWCGWRATIEFAF